MTFKQITEQQQREQYQGEGLKVISKYALESQVREEVEQQLRHFPTYWLQCVTVKEAATLLTVTPDTVRTWIACGKLPASQPGKEWIIRLSHIDSLLRTTANVRPINNYKIGK